MQQAAQGVCDYQGFPTSNHYGATADSLVLGYRVRAKLLYADTLQYHPTGAAFPQQIFGALVTENGIVHSVQSLSTATVKILCTAGETRDVAAASIIREMFRIIKRGLIPGNGEAVWLDTPMIEAIGGEVR